MSFARKSDPPPFLGARVDVSLPGCVTHPTSYRLTVEHVVEEGLSLVFVNADTSIIEAVVTLDAQQWKQLGLFEIAVCSEQATS